MKIIQVLDALDFGDGVSNDVINKYELLKEMGYETAIYSKWTHETVRHYQTDIKQLRVGKEDILLHHFSGESHILDKVKKIQCKKVLIYHNITPQNFLEDSRKSQKNKLSQGELQLLENKNEYDFFLGVSQFNVECLKELGITSQANVFPIYIDFSKIRSAKVNEIRENPSQKIFTFIGRVVANKKHEDIIDIFEEYYTNINSNSRLMLVGNYEDYLDYYSKLCSKVKNLNCRNAVNFTGKVSDEELYNYFYNGDIFICMSEHEGFCIPLLESMCCKVPTMAFDACAISSTMGNAGVLVKYKEPKALAKLAHMIVTEEVIRKEIIERQLEWIDSFSKESLKSQMQILINKWSGGQKDE